MDLKVDYERMRDLGNQVVEQAGEFQTDLNSIKNVNSQLASYWEGKDASKYSTAVAAQVSEMQKLSDLINDIGLFLIKIGEAYRQASEDNESGVRI